MPRAPPARGPLAALASGASAATDVRAAAAPYGDVDDDASTRISGGFGEFGGLLAGSAAPASVSAGALAGAFSQAVSTAPLSSFDTPGGDEWHVGINGSPVGPLRLGELRSKAASGAVTASSLVWREGLEEWQQLRHFPELLAIVEEGASSARASLTPFELADGLARIPGSAGAPATGPGVVTESMDLGGVAGIPQRRSSSAAAWIAMVVALLFGLTIGFVVFKGNDKVVEKIVEVPVKPGEVVAPAAGGGVEPGEVAVSGDPASSAKVAGRGGPVRGGPVASGETAKPGDPVKPIAGLSGLSGVDTGPRGGPGETSAPSSAGQPLDADSVQRTVARYKTSVQRSCWQPALDARDKDAPSSARVSVSVTVGPSGSVQSVSNSGDPKGYRGLAGCISSRVRGWTFPASTGTTTVNVPFVFAAQ